MKSWIMRAALVAIAATLIPACGGGVKTFTTVNLVTAIGILVNSLTSSSNGGTGLTLDGGQGGDFDVSGSTGSDIRVLKTGTVNSMVTIPVIKPDLGTNSREVSANETWTVDTGAGGVLNWNSATIQGGSPGTATGLWVKPGVTLTIHPNFGGGFSGAAHNFLQLNFSAGIFIQGTIRVQYQDTVVSADALSDDCSSFTLSFDQSLVISSTGAIILTGRADGPDADTFGGNGGNFTANGNRLTIVNAGTINAQGGAGERGGAGGSVNMMTGQYGCYNSGMITTSGATGLVPSFAGPAGVASNLGFVGANTDYTLTAPPPAWVEVGNNVRVINAVNGNNNGDFLVVAIVGNVVTLQNGSGVADVASAAQFTLSLNTSHGFGGNAGTIYLRAMDFAGPGAGGTFNTGSLLALGAAGTANGGSGGFIQMASYTELGAVTTSGTINNSGASAGVASTDGFGGSGGGISLQSESGSIRATGDLLSVGGNGVGLGDGGSGGGIDIFMENDGPVSSQSLTGSLAIGATMNTNGGNGRDGGNAGSIDITADGGSSARPPNDVVWIVGYNAIVTNGGAGQINGGDGGTIGLTNDENGTIGNAYYQGGIINEVPMFTLGGAGATGNGGDAGDIDFFNTDNDSIDMGRKTVNSAPLDLRGGVGFLVAGNGGFFSMYDVMLVENSGVITATGGANGGGGGTAGDGGGIILVCDDITNNTADLLANGGVSTDGDGGWGGGIQVLGRTTTTRGTLNASGGNGGIGAGDVGGSGGDIEVWSTETTSGISGILTVSAATGEPIVGGGTHGQVRVDGNIVELTVGAITFP